MEEADKIFLEYVVKALVDNPNDIKIDRTVDEMGVLITLTVNPADMGKIIGRMGNTAKAIRTLLRIIGMKNNARVNLKINEPEGSTREPREQRDDKGGDREETSGTSDSYVRPPHQSPTLKTVDQAMEDLKGI
ncbi:MAG: KH domain-containing protein [Candidatus Paceibacterota bacterium]